MVANGGRNDIGDVVERGCMSSLVTFSQLHKTDGVKNGKTELWVPCSPVTCPCAFSRYNNSSLELVASGTELRERLFEVGKVENWETFSFTVVSVHPPLLNVVAARL